MATVQTSAIGPKAGLYFSSILPGHQWVGPLSTDLTMERTGILSPWALEFVGKILSKGYKELKGKDHISPHRCFRFYTNLLVMVGNKEWISPSCENVLNTEKKKPSTTRDCSLCSETWGYLHVWPEEGHKSLQELTATGGIAGRHPYETCVPQTHIVSSAFEGHRKGLWRWQQGSE